MSNDNRRARALTGLAFAAMAALPALAAADEVIAVTSDDTLVRFDTASPGTILNTVQITGLNGHVLAIDVRPQNGELFVLTDTNRVYRLDAPTGAAVQVGTGTFTPALTGTDVGMDFNPSTDRIRVVTDQNANFRLDPTTGKVVDADLSTGGTQLDTNLTFAPTDANAGADPNVVGLAFTGASGASTTTAFGIDSNLDVLVRLGDLDGGDTTRSAGVLYTVGSLGVDTTGMVGFDVSRTVPGVAFAVLTLNGETTSKLYRIDLATGAATLIAPLGETRTIRAMAIGPATPISTGGSTSLGLVGLTQGGEIVKFSTTTPATITTRVAVTGLAVGDTLVAIDSRVSRHELFALSNTGHLYRVNVDTGVATLVRQDPLEVALVGTSFGFDVDPQNDVLRVVSDTGLNLRVDPDTGAVLDADLGTAGVQGDTNLAFAPTDVNVGQSAHVVAIAYDRNDAGNQTTLYGIDSNADALVRIGSAAGTPELPGTGLVHTIGSLGVDTTDVASFEIANNDTAIAALTGVGGTTSLYRIDLSTGAATLVGPIGTGEVLTGLTVSPQVTSAGTFAITRLQMKFDFRRTGRDSMTVQGNLPVDLPLSGATVAFDVGGFQQTFTLNAKGTARDKEGTRSSNDDDRFVRIGKVKNGVLKFKATFHREDLQTPLADEGLVGTEELEHVTKNVVVTVTVNGTVYTTTVNLDFSARPGRNGIAHSVGVATQQ